MERVYTAAEVLAAMRQVRRDYDDIPVGDGIGRITDRERLTAHVAIQEVAQLLDINADLIFGEWRS
jgi:hypothetical protein